MLALLTCVSFFYMFRSSACAFLMFSTTKRSLSELACLLLMIWLLTFLRCCRTVWRRGTWNTSCAKRPTSTDAGALQSPAPSSPITEPSPDALNPFDSFISFSGLSTWSTQSTDVPLAGFATYLLFVGICLVWTSLGVTRSVEIFLFFVDFCRSWFDSTSPRRDDSLFLARRAFVSRLV